MLNQRFIPSKYTRYMICAILSQHNVLKVFFYFVQMNRKSIRGCQKTLHKLQRKVDELHSTNTGLDRQLLEMEVSVAERQQIERLAGT